MRTHTLIQIRAPTNFSLRHCTRTRPGQFLRMSTCWFALILLSKSTAPGQPIRLLRVLAMSSRSRGHISLSLSVCLSIAFPTQPLFCPREFQAITERFLFTFPSATKHCPKGMGDSVAVHEGSPERSAKSTRRPQRRRKILQAKLVPVPRSTVPKGMSDSVLPTKVALSDSATSSEDRRRRLQGSKQKEPHSVRVTEWFSGMA